MSASAEHMAQAVKNARTPTVIFGSSTRQQVLEQSRLRLGVIVLFFGLSFFVISLRVIELSLPEDGEELRLLSENMAAPEGMNLMTLIKGSPEELAAILDKNSLDAGRESVVLPREDIVDRNGLVLATSLKTASLYADAREIRGPQQVASALMGALPGFDRDRLIARLASGKSFAWLRRNLTPQEQKKVNDLGIPGLDFLTEYVRVYPHGPLFAHSLGFVGVDNRGLAGIERFFDTRLRESESGEPLKLSLDMRIQQMMHEELSNAMQEFRAIGAVGVVADVKTGEVLSLVSLPDFDPNHPGRTVPETLFNRASLGTYEMGSSFKTFTVASALESGTIGLSDGFDASHPIKAAGFTISDYHAKNRWLSVPEIFAYSSNIGTARMAMEVGIERQKSFFRKLGLLEPVRIEIPERGQPQYPSDWRELSMMTVSYGHGISVTPLHLVQAYTGILNEGKAVPLTLLANPPHIENKKVVSADTSHKVRRLLRSVVQYGTGKSAEAQGYRVGGKTGTADKVSGRGYNRNSRIASFMGAFPMDDPRYVIFVMVDEPKGTKATYGYATGGWVAAPVASRVIGQMGPMLGIPPVFDVPRDGLDAIWDNLLNAERERQRRIHAVSY